MIAVVDIMTAPASPGWGGAFAPVRSQGVMEYAKPTVTELGSVADLTLTFNKQWGFSDSWILIKDKGTDPVWNGGS
jgi:hypothetical protein